MKWQGFVLILTGACLYALYDVLNKKLLLKKAPDECIRLAPRYLFLG